MSMGSPPPAEELSWVCHPARRRPVAAALTTALLALLCVGVWCWFHDPFLTGLSALVLLFSLSPFYLPTRYLIAQDSVTIRATFGERKKSLDLYRRIQADRHGVLLSPFDRPSRLDRFHGLNLRFDAPDRDRVVGFFQRRFPKREPAPVAEPPVEV
jgi:hypothetical protein